MRIRRPPVGAPPGTIAHPSPPEPARITAYAVGPTGLREHACADADELALLRHGATLLWVDVQGLDDPTLAQKLGTTFDLHPLALADAFNTPQRPKADPYGDQLVLVGMMARCTGEAALVTLEQLTIIVGPTFVLTFQDKEHEDVLAPVRARLRNDQSILQKNGAAYLAYAMLDAVVDAYYPVLERLGEQLDEVEDRVHERPSREVLRDVQHLRRTLLALRRALWPQRDALASLARDDSPLAKDAGLRLHLRDCYDHAGQLLDILESYRELTTSLAEGYMSSLSIRMNEIMKVLTMISTIFIPLSFIAGVYGMNFEHMPELHSRFGYPAVLVGMGLLALVMVLVFARRGWFR